MQYLHEMRVDTQQCVLRNSGDGGKNLLGVIVAILSILTEGIV